MRASLLDGVQLDYVDESDELEPEAYDPDPVPAEATRKQPRRTLRQAVAPSARPVSALTRKRIAAELHAYGELLALGVVVRDETCGTVLHEQVKPMADAIADILADYPDLAAKFIASGVIGKWVKLLVVTKPVVEVVWRHHVARSIEPVEGGDRDLIDDGRYAPFRAGARG